MCHVCIFSDKKLFSLDLIVMATVGSRHNVFLGIGS